MFYGKYKVGLFSLGLASGLMGCPSSQSLELPTPSPSALPTATLQPQPTLSDQAPSIAASPDLAQYLPIAAEAVIAEQVFQLEVALTPTQQEKGLMYRPPLPDDRGMLFPYEPARFVGFWMRNVPVPLDMVFLYKGRVVEIAASVPPCPASSQTCPIYGPRSLVDQVLELRAGRAQELNLKAGDRISIRFKPS